MLGGIALDLPVGRCYTHKCITKDKIADNADLITQLMIGCYLYEFDYFVNEEASVVRVGDYSDGESDSSDGSDGSEGAVGTET